MDGVGVCATFVSDGCADHLELRILLCCASGLRSTVLTEQNISEAVIRLLLGNP